MNGTRWWSVCFLRKNVYNIYIHIYTVWPRKTELECHQELIVIKKHTSWESHNVYVRGFGWDRMTTEAEVLPQIPSMCSGCKISWLESQHAVSTWMNDFVGVYLGNPSHNNRTGPYTGPYFRNWKMGEIQSNWPYIHKIETWHLSQDPMNGSARFQNLFHFHSFPCIAQFESQKRGILKNQA